MSGVDYLKFIKEELEAQGKRLSNIEVAVQSIGVQENKIANLQAQVTDLWRKYDDISKPEGTISKIQKFQASCPRRSIPRIWWAIGLNATALITILGSIIILVIKI